MPSLNPGFYEIPPGHIAAVVTHLEMLAPPEPRPEVEGSLWQLEPWPRPDVAEYQALFRRVGQSWLWFSRLKLGREAVAAIVEHPDVEVSILRVDGQAEGLLELDFRQPGQCELAFLGVSEQLVGSGAGTWLMNRAIQRAWSRPIRRFWLHTCTLDHPGAVAFYRKHGFTPYRLEVEVDIDPRVSGVLPREAAPRHPLIGAD